LALGESSVGTIKIPVKAALAYSTVRLHVTEMSTLKQVVVVPAEYIKMETE
jgi:hypothetical protein